MNLELNFVHNKLVILFLRMVRMSLLSLYIRSASEYSWNVTFLFLSGMSSRFRRCDFMEHDDKIRNAREKKRESWDYGKIIT